MTKHLCQSINLIHVGCEKHKRSVMQHSLGAVLGAGEPKLCMRYNTSSLLSDGPRLLKRHIRHPVPHASSWLATRSACHVSGLNQNSPGRSCPGRCSCACTSGVRRRPCAWRQSASVCGGSTEAGSTQPRKTSMSYGWVRHLHAVPDKQCHTFKTPLNALNDCDNALTVSHA